MDLAMNMPTGNDAMTTILMAVSPQQAQAWLDAMPIQRRLRKAKVEQLARIIVEGRWRVMPNGIAFNRQGRVSDGQHRLHAIVKAGKTVSVRCTFNVDDDLFLLIDDTQTPKTLEDALKFNGVPPGLCPLLAEPVRMLYREERGVSPLQPGVRPTNTEGIEVFERHPRLIEAGSMASRCRLAPSRGMMAFCVYKGLLVDDELTRIFVDQCAIGEGLRAGDSALLLRNTWMNDRAHRVRRQNGDILLLMMTALRDVLQGRKRSTWRSLEFGKGKLPTLER